ncbi:MAG: LPS export ABC transporter periplasmic protein LptC [Kiritimatiellia bacterium]
MKILIPIISCCVSAAFGFDSEGWLEKRAVLDREAERLADLYGRCVTALQTPAENLVVPIENYPDGRVKASVTAARAQYFIDEGIVWGEDVVVREFAPDGTPRGEVHAKNCVVDRSTKSGYVAGHAKVTYGRTTIEGEGIYFSFAEEFVKILSNVVIESKDMKIEGVRL